MLHAWDSSGNWKKNNKIPKPWVFSLLVYANSTKGCHKRLCVFSILETRDMYQYLDKLVPMAVGSYWQGAQTNHPKSEKKNDSTVEWVYMSLVATINQSASLALVNCTVCSEKKMMDCTTHQLLLVQDLSIEDYPSHWSIIVYGNYRFLDYEIFTELVWFCPICDYNFDYYYSVPLIKLNQLS